MNQNVPKIAVISNVNCDFIQRDLSKKYNMFFAEGYGNWISYCLLEESDLMKFEPDYIFVLLHGNELFPTLEESDETVNTSFDYLTVLLNRFKETSIFVSTVSCSIYNKVGNELDMRNHIRSFWDNKLYELTCSHTNAFRFELDSLICKIGIQNAYSSKLWYTASIPFSIAAVKEIEREIELCIRRVKMKRKKVFAVDLDNTLWGGIVGEVGFSNIEIGNSKKGLIFRDVQKLLLKLKNAGGLLVAISKNNIEDIEEVFRNNQHMVLKKSDFALIYANWEEKTVNIKSMLEILNLNEDACVFLDDNQVERDKVRLGCPSVTVLDYPDEICDLPARVEQFIDEYFFLWNILDDDRRKTEMYHDNQKRIEAQNRAIDFEEYLHSLNTLINIYKAKLKDIKRIEQLLNKTNQFNTKTIRMNASEIEKYIMNDDKYILLIDVGDKYGQSGVVGAIMINRLDNKVIIDNFVLSCRVMGRRIEDAIVSCLVNRFYDIGIRTVETEYIPTSKNIPVSELWDREGFLLDSINENGVKKYYLNVSKIEEYDFCKVNIEL